MKISILTLFPEMFDGPFSHSILKHAKEKGLVTIETVNIRDFGIGRHKMVDDTAYGGGRGMVMRVDVLHEAVERTKDPTLSKEEQQVILLDARGQTFTQQIATSLISYKHLIIICGHYEGVDERIRTFVDQTISIGDYILTGGEIPAMIVTDSVVRLIPEVLTDEATTNESFSETEDGRYIEYPQYTKPREYNGLAVPDVLLSGNHKEIAAWRKEQAKNITLTHRPDLVKNS